MPLQSSNDAWMRASNEKLLKPICIFGNCANGYGVSINNNRGFAIKYQYEGEHNNFGERIGLGIITNSDGSKRVAFCKGNFEDVGGYLIEEHGFVTLRNASGNGVLTLTDEYGFTLSEVMFSQNNSFQGMKKCNCIATENENYKNKCSKRVYVRYISRTIRTRTNKYDYYDNSFILEPGESIERQLIRSTFDLNGDNEQLLGFYCK